MDKNRLNFEEDVKIIKKTCRELMCNQEEIGQRIYQQVITKSVSMSRLFYNCVLHKQAALFMEMLSTVVGYLEDENIMDTRLGELGRIHALRHGVKTKYYKHFRTAFMKVVRVYIPWNERRENAWQWFWDRMISAMTVDNNSPILPFNLPEAQYADYVSAIRESFDNAIDQSPLEVIEQFHNLLLKEQPVIANLFLPTLESKNCCARLFAMLRYTLRLLDDPQEFEQQINSLIIRYKSSGITEHQLNILIQTFIRILQQLNNHKWQPIHDRSWQWLSQSISRIFLNSQVP